MDPFVIFKWLIFCGCVAASAYMTRLSFRESAGQAFPLEGCMVGAFCLGALAALGALLIFV